MDESGTETESGEKKKNEDDIKTEMDKKTKDDELAWQILDKYFTDNPNNLVRHHLESFNNFFNNGLLRILKENNPIRFTREIKKEEEEEEEEEEEKKNEEEPPSTCELYIGGKEGNKVYYGKPVIYDNQNTHYMYPNDARLRNMTYGMTIHYDVDVVTRNYTYNPNEKKYILEENNFTLEKILLGTFPIMLQSNFCILDGMSRDVRFYMGECRNDYGGYFIIDGKEKVIVCQEKFANNQLSLTTNKIGSTIRKKYLCSASVKSVSADVSKPKRTTRVMIVTGSKQKEEEKDTEKKENTRTKQKPPNEMYTNNQIVVDVPNVTVPVPLFILMRALGIISDKEIIKTCLLDITKEESYVDLFIPSVHDASEVFTQSLALEYIATFTKKKTIEYVLKILADMFLPHIGDVNFLDKAYYLGHMVFRLLRVYTKQDPDTNIDEYNFKRIETSGALLDDLFGEYYLLQIKHISLKIEKEDYYNNKKYLGNHFFELITDNQDEFFKERIVEDGFKKAFKGNWGSELHTKRVGIVQDLSRLSWNSTMTHLRKITLQIDKTSKVVGPRKLNNSQWGLIDPFDTPDGSGVGLDKHFTILARVTAGTSPETVINWLNTKTEMRPILYCNNAKYIYSTTKIFVNGTWLGVVDKAIELLNKFKLTRRLGLFPYDVSISFNYKNEININTDAGRLIRPVYYFLVDEGIKRLAVLNAEVLDPAITWNHIQNGFLEDEEIKQIQQSLEPKELDKFKNKQCLIEYVDTEEEQSALIASTFADIDNNKKNFYTHMEIDASLILSVMGNLVAYPEHNPITRNSFSCGQSKQAVSLYHTNYQLRMDKMAVVLNYGQVPLIKSRYLNYINKEEMPYGVNTIVAIMSYTGYNVEDAILINEGAIQRGLFRTTYLTTYEGREESSKIKKKNVEVSVDTKFSNVENNLENLFNIDEDYDYSKLDTNGFISEYSTDESGTIVSTEVNDKTVLIGKLTTDPEDPTKYVDTSVHTKKGQTGHVDKVYVSVGEDGYKIAKVRIREDRIPSLGDKMASRCGQKGTIGLIIPEKDMPFTADGVRPDLIINPHALPSRMTIGQLVECMFGKACASNGSFGEGTAFKVDGSNYSTYGEILQERGYHSSGNQLLYDGITGEQIEANIFIGPTYYMRLKHMVKDKINHRDEGPNTSLTRQPVQGRSNDGGLRIGEMERDGVLAHGMSKFLNESFMVRSGDDHFELAVCNKTGAVAIFNRQRNLFLSPLSDGPIKFNTDTKKPDEDFKIESVSRFGRSFSVVLVPYTFKLLMQELQVLNIQMRIITDDNVDQLMSLCYSDNIKKLLQIKNKPLEDVITNYTQGMNLKTARPVVVGKEGEKVLSWIEKFRDTKEDVKIKQLHEAISFVVECYNHMAVNNNFTQLEGGIRPLPTQIEQGGNWYLTKEVAIATITYIFTQVKCNCYLLCVITDNKTKRNKLIKLEPQGIPQFFESLIKKITDVKTLKTLTAQIGDLKQKVLDNTRMRLMGCRLSRRKDEDFSVEYKKFVSELQHLPDGLYVLNLTDAVIIRADNMLPWQQEQQRDNKYLPVFSLSGAKDFVDIPMPNYDEIVQFWPDSNNPNKPVPIVELNKIREQYPWSQKKFSIAVFRGQPTGCGLTADTNARINLAEMAVKLDNQQYLDAGLTKLFGPVRYDAGSNKIDAINIKKLGEEETAEEGATLPPLPLMPKKSYAEQANFKYIIHIDGNVAAYRLISMMLLGSVILKVEGDYTLWYEHLLVKWDDWNDPEAINDKKYNCISIEGDLSNLISTIENCRQNDKICEQIAANGVELAQMILNKEYIETSFTNMLIKASQVAKQNEEYAPSPDFPDYAPPSPPQSPDLPPRPEYLAPDNSGNWLVNKSTTRGKQYWFNSKTGESRWLQNWSLQTSNSTGKQYWFNSSTGESHYVAEEPAQLEPYIPSAYQSQLEPYIPPAYLQEGNNEEINLEWNGGNNNNILEVHKEKEKDEEQKGGDKSASEIKSIKI